MLTHLRKKLYRLSLISLAVILFTYSTSVLFPLKVLADDPCNQNVANGLIGWWKMDEAGWNGTNGEVIDSSGSSNNGVAATSGSTVPTTTSGYLGNAGSFNGADQYINVIPFHNLPLDKGYTLSAWIDPTSPTGWILSYGNYGDGNGTNILGFRYGYLFTNDWWGNMLDTHFGPGGTDPDITDSWHLLTATYDGTNRSIYLDGVLLGSDTPGVMSMPIVNNFTIGSGYDGLLDDVRVYDRGLSQSEISTLYAYNANCTGSHQILNLDSSLSAHDVAWNRVQQGDPHGLDSSAATLVRLKDATTGILLAEAPTVNTIQDRSWNNVSGSTDLASGRAVIHNLDSASGVSGTTTLYVVALRDSTGVYVCPNATQMSQVGGGCSGGHVASAANTRTYTYQGITYWKVTGLSGSEGALNAVNNSPYSGGACSADVTSGLVGWWRMNESAWDGTPGEVADYSGNGNNGTVHGSTLPTTVSTPGGIYRAGSFNGTDQYVEITPFQRLPITGGYTYSFWFKPNNMDQHIMGYGNYGNGGQVNEVGLAYGWAVTNGWWGNDLGTHSAPNGGTSDLTLDWHHMVATYDGTTRSIYMDKQLLGSDTPGPRNDMPNNVISFKIGDGSYSGMINDVRLYNRGISQSEINDLNFFESACGTIQHHILDVDGNSLTPLDLSNNSILIGSPNGLYGADQHVRIKDNNTSLIVAEAPYVDMTEDRSWPTVTAASDSATGKAVVHNLETADGVSGTHILYIPKTLGSSGVFICPNATQLNDVSDTCPGGYFIKEGVSVVIIAGAEYWQVTGLSGTGGMSISEGGFNTRDTLTRLQAAVASNHTIYFGTVNGLLTPSDTIQLQFDPAGLQWSLAPITVNDIDLVDNGTTSLPLAGTPDVNTWGVDINTSTETITFTAPSSGSDYIAAGHQIMVKIGSNASGGVNQLVNPAASVYQIAILMTNSVGTETGQIQIPIIDDDTVNVTGFIETFISFDIDTADTNSNCDAQGGSAPCNSHGGSSDGAGYIVDLGEMTTSTVNVSGATVLHADGASGAINSIWFDLSTNAASGATVNVYSLNNGLLGPNSSNIPSVGSGEVQILPGSSLYGIQNRVGDVNSTTSGTININTDCAGTSGNDYYCSVGGTAGRAIFDTNASPVDSARIQFRVGASPNSQNPTGTYTDELTFIATPTF